MPIFHSSKFSRLPLFCAVAAASFYTQASEEVFLEEVVVTAQKRAQDLQEVPLSISSFDGKALAEQGVVNTWDLAASIPNLDIQGTQGGVGMVVRGITTSQQANASLEDNTALHIDGFYVPVGANAALDFVDVQRIEVLRGPQGTLYGRNATGGVMNIISNSPDTEEQSAWVEGEVGNFGSYAARAVVNTPISDNAAFRLAGLYRETDGWMENVATGDDYLANEVWAVKAAFRYTGDRVSVDFKIDAFSEDGDGTPLGRVNNDVFIPLDTRPDAFKDLYILPGAHQTSALDEERTEDIWGVGLTLDFQLTDDISLKSLTGYRDVDIFFASDLDGLNRDTGFDFFDQLAESFSQEFQFYSTNADSKLQWLVDFYYYESTLSWNIDVWTERDAALPPLTAQQFISTFQETDTEAWAVFGNLSYAITDQLSVQVGLRYNDEQKDNREINEFQVSLKDCESDSGIVPGVTWCQLIGLPSGVVLAAAGDIQQSESWNDVTGDITLTYDFNDDVMVYGRYARGFKSGGFNFLLVPPPFAEEGVFDPEIVDNFEIGIRADWPNGRVRTNLTAFQMDFTDQQINRIERDANNVPFFISENAGESTIRGLEAELTVQITDELRLDANGAYLDAEYDKYFQGELDFSGQQMGAAPEYTVSAALTYTTQVGDGTLNIRGEVQDVDDTPGPVAAPDGVTITELVRPGYTLFNASATYQIDDWTFTLFGRNLNDEEYFYSVVEGAVPATNQQIPQRVGWAPPRTYGLKVRYDF